MEAIRLHPNPDTSNPYSEADPAPSSALRLVSNLPIPKPLNPGQLLIKVEATTVIRDSLTWPETYRQEYTILGNDFAGTVIEVNEETNGSPFKPGDEVYGMTDAARGGAWSSHTVISAEEACLKPKSLTWAQAAATPLSALTAYQCLFEHGGISPPDFSNLQSLRPLQKSKTSAKKGQLLITGASGNVGLYIVQLARLTNIHVVAATRSNTHNKSILARLGADEIVEYDALTKDPRRFDVIIDTVGGDFLKTCWSLIKREGHLVTIDSPSYDFIEEHRKLGLLEGDEKVKAVWFVVSPNQTHLKHLSAIIEADLFEPFVACVMPLADARLAYDQGSVKSAARGKIILTPTAH